MLAISTPFPQFFDLAGAPLNAGAIYIGLPGQDPVAHPALVTWDPDGQVPAPQPVATISGVPARGGSPALLYVPSGSYSILVKDRTGRQVFYCDDAVKFSSDVMLEQPSGAGQIGFNSEQGYPKGTIGGALAALKYADSYSTLSQAVAGAAGRRLVIGPGAYSVTSDLDCGSAELAFMPGAMLTVPAGVTVTIRNPVVAGNYQIFARTGNIVVAGEVNPMWWGALPAKADGTTTQAQAVINTAAFRKAAKSFFADYNPIAGSLSAPGSGVGFSVAIPAGVWDLSNGFAAAVGVRVRGQSSSITLLRRLTSNYDADQAIPLLTIGQTLAAAPALTYQNDAVAGQSLSPFTASNAGESAAMASDLYFIDQNPGVAAFAPRYPGCQFHSLFFTSCGIAIDLNHTADITGSNIIVDMGLTALSLGNCQNIKLSNVIIYDTVSQSVAVGANVFDCSLDVHIEYPQGVAVNIAGSCKNLRFPNFTVTQNSSVGTNAVICNASNVDVTFQNAVFRNLGNCSAVQIAGGLTGVSMRFTSPIFDGLRTNSVYNQNANMQAFSVSSGSVHLENAVMRNLGVRSIFVGTAALHVDGLRYGAMAAAASVFDLSGCTAGDAAFFGVKGDGVVPLLTAALGSATVRVKGSLDWLGSPFTDGSYLAWNVPLPAFGQIMATVSAQPDATASVRKSATVLFEKSVEALPTLTDTITSTTLFASPSANGHAALTPTLVFSGGTTSQAVGAVSPTAGKLRVPNTYSAAVANVDFLA